MAIGKKKLYPAIALVAKLEAMSSKVHASLEKAMALVLPLEAKVKGEKLAGRRHARVSANASS